MSAKALLEELRERDVRLEADGLALNVDAPARALTEELHVALREHKRALIRLLERERRKLEEAGEPRAGDQVLQGTRLPLRPRPHDGRLARLLASGCPPWMLEDAKMRRRRKGRANR